MSGSLLEAGSDTTASTLYGFIQAMIVWPEVQKKAQAEIDCVVGPDRLPTVDDYDELHYIRCCIKESLRWMPTVILGVPHSVMRDDTYGNYVIPKGSTVINNVWYDYAPSALLRIHHTDLCIQGNPYGPQTLP